MASPPRHLLSHLKERFPRLAEVVRNLRPSLIRKRRRWRGLSTEAVFTTIYEEGRWGAGAESMSGGGSSVEYTKGLVETLPGVWRELGVRTLLDAPCGDFNWMRTVDRSALEAYVGADIVTSLVERLQAEHGDDRHRFVRLDVARDPLPEADLVLCRDCLVHLPNDDVRRVLENVRRSACRYFMSTSYSDVRYNPDVYTGGVRILNLCRPPFSLPDPIRAVDDPATGRGGRRILGVWEREQLG